MKQTFREQIDSLPPEAFTGDGIAFRPIRTEADLTYAVFDCRLTEEQQELVNPAGFSIGRAYLNPDNNYPCVILNGHGDRVGFINLDRWLGSGDAFNWSYYIDQDQQGRGYGRKAAALAIRMLKTVDPQKTIKLSAEASNRKAQALYLSLGFSKLDERDGDDLVFGL